MYEGGTASEKIDFGSKCNIARNGELDLTFGWFNQKSDPGPLD
jgi:hypothetical protein